MALSPLDQTSEQYVEVDVTAQPSKTYQLNYETGELGGVIDEEDALRQFIEKAVRTARFRYLAYSDQYGCEIEDLIGADVTTEYLETEIPRVITEALIYDDRIDSVSDFEVTRSGDTLSVSFSVTPVSATPFEMEVDFVNG